MGIYTVEQQEMLIFCVKSNLFSNVYIYFFIHALARNSKGFLFKLMNFFVCTRNHWLETMFLSHETIVIVSKKSKKHTA